MFEHRKKPLLSREAFVKRIFRNTLIAFIIIIISLGIGMVGYHYTAHLSWLDSLLNASMILTGMGPVNFLTTPPAKIFASFYALFSGIAFLTTIAVLIAPVLHRFLHHFHFENEKR